MVRILDAQGNTVVKYAYDPWGVPTIEGAYFFDERQKEVSRT